MNYLRLLGLAASLALAAGCGSDTVPGTTVIHAEGSEGPIGSGEGHSLPIGAPLPITPEGEGEGGGGEGGGGQGCGNGIVEANEQCDGINLNGWNCMSLGEGSGTLQCDPQTCTYDASMCSGSPVGMGGAGG